MRYLILALCLLVAGSASAVPVDHAAPDGVAASVSYWMPEHNGYEATTVILTTSGWVYALMLAADDHSMEWAWVEGLSDRVPISVAEIADWTPSSFVTLSGVRYFHNWRILGRDNWMTFGDGVPSVPEDPVKSESESMGDVKSMFR